MGGAEGDVCGVLRHDEGFFIQGPQGRLWVSASQPLSSRSRLPVVLVHADLGTLHQWDEIRIQLEDRHPTIAFDRRGHGRSDLPRDGDFSFASSASDIGAVIDQLGIRTCALVGHSGGAIAAWSYAAAHAERVAGVLLVDPPREASTLPPDTIEQTLRAVRGPDFKQVAEDYYRSIAGSNPAVVKRVIAEARATPQATLVACFEALRDFEPRLLAGLYAGPMLSIIQPRNDATGGMHRILPGWPHTVIARTGHWIHLDAPSDFLTHARAFLDRLARTDTSPVDTN